MRDDLVRLSGADDDFNLDGAAINEKTIELLEGLASAVRLMEDDIGNTAALRVGAVRELNTLDGANRLDKVFLYGASSG